MFIGGVHSKSHRVSHRVRVRLDLWVLAEISSNVIKPFFDPGFPGFPLMQLVGSLVEP